MSGAGCSGPGFDESQTIQEACRAASLDVRAVLAAFDHFVQDPDGPIEARSATAKLHQIQGGRSALS